MAAMLEGAAALEKLAAMKVTFAAGLPDKIAEIELASKDSLEAVRTLAHKLAGSAGTYGYPDLGQTTRDLELICDAALEQNLTPADEALVQVQALIFKLREQAAQTPEASAGAPQTKSEEISTDIMLRSLRPTKDIILVEDDIDQAAMLFELLSNFGFSVRVLDHPSLLAAALAVQLPAVVIMDIMFPDGRDVGLTTVKRLQDEGRLPCPVVFVSVRDDFEARLEAIRCGGADYIVKPVQILELVERLDQLIDATAEAPGIRVLLVDDDPDTTTFCATVLEGYGHVTLSINDPVMVIAAVEGFDPDVIVLDVEMPGCNGFELASMLGQMDGALFNNPILFLTKHTDLITKHEAVLKGGADFLSKPVDPEQLLASVVAWGECYRLLSRTYLRKQTSDERFAAVTRTANEAIVSVNQQGTILLWNQSAERIFGYQASEVLGMPMDILIPERSREALWEKFHEKNFYENLVESPVTFELLCLGKDGLEFLMEVALSALKSEGEVVYTVIMRGTAKHQKALGELAARDRELQFQKWALDEHAIVSIADAKGAITYINDKFCQISGYSRDELIGQNHRIVKSDEQSDVFFKDLWRTIAKGKTWKGEIKNKRKDGGHYWVMTTIVPFMTGDGKPFQYVSIRTDVSERKRTELELRASQKRFERAALLTSDWLWETDEADRITYFSANFFDGTDLTSEDFLGKSLVELVKPESIETEEWQALVATRKARKAYRDFEYMVEIGGQQFRLSSSGEPFYNEFGVFKGYLGAVREVSAIKAMEEQLASARRLESLGQLTGGVAHEFNNLLAVIGGYAEQAIKHHADQAKVDGALKIIVDAVEQGASLTKQMLTIGRRHGDKFQLISLNEVIHDLAKLLPPLIGEQIQLGYDLTTEDVVIDADKAQISQAVMNLCINARDAMSRNGILTIKTFIHDAEDDTPLRNVVLPKGQYAALSIRDTGHGMDSENISKIFDPFFTTKEIGEGTGLGLAMVYSVMQDSAGYIDVRSVIGKGTTFTLYLPQREEERGEVVDSPVLNALVVDEMVMITEMVAVSLEQIGYQSLQVSEQGEMAEIEGVVGGEFDLVVLSTTLREIDGIEFGQRLKAENPNLLVVYTSPRAAHGGDLRERIGDGALVLQKPFDPDLLADLVINQKYHQAD